MNSPKRLLCCTAHPDDECFAFGGALALAARAGFATHIVCFTEGTAGSFRGGSQSDAELGQMRRKEMAASCEILGVQGHEVLTFQDGKLEHANFRECTLLLVERMRRIRPHIVITFGTDGGLNVHNDHTMVSNFASTAFRWAARAKRFPEFGETWQAEKLFHVSTDFTLPDREPLLPEPWTVKLDIRSVQEVKEAAFKAHTSQLPMFDKVKPFWKEHGGWEYYTLAGASSPVKAQLMDELFA